MNRRGFFNLLLGSAAVVGLDTTFGLDTRPRDFLANGHRSVDPVLPTGEDFVMDLRPGAINRVPAGFRWVESFRQEFDDRGPLLVWSAE